MTEQEIKTTYERDGYVVRKDIIDDRDLDPMGRKIGRMEKGFPPSNPPAFHLASPHIKFTLEIGMYTCSDVNASEPLRFKSGLFSAKALTDFHIQTERDPTE